jgi:hypothetical protein
MVFVATTGLTKISNLLFYLRMGAGSSNKTWVYINYGGIVIIAIYMGAFILNTLFICDPIDSYWKSFSLTYNKPYHCRMENVTGPMVGIGSVLTDIVAAVFPAFLFKDLHISRREKIGLWLVFGLGLM